jgi:hypothetical protein
MPDAHDSVQEKVLAIFTELVGEFVQMYQVRPRGDKRGIDLIFDVAAIRSLVVWRAGRNRQCNGLRPPVGRLA